MSEEQAVSFEELSEEEEEATYGGAAFSALVRPMEGGDEEPIYD